MDIEEKIEKYSDILYKICFLILKNNEDALDAVSETFFIYINKKPSFADKNHEKYWFIKVASNKAKNILRFNIKRNHISLEDIRNLYLEEKEENLLYEIFKLKENEKIVLLLHYYEGYKVKEISKILGISENAVLKRLERARKSLKNILEEEL